jgi:LysM repeat protein
MWSLNHMRRITLLFVLIIGLGTLVSAQSSELLNNPGLEEGSFGPYTTRRGGEFPIYLPNGWNIWLASPTGEFTNRSDRTSVNPHPGPGPNPKEGTRALNVDCGFVTCTASIYQQVSVQQGSNVQANAWAQVKACNVATGSTSCGSAVESGSQTRIGIDPNGGTDPTDSDIVWSGWVQPHDQWLQMSVSATTTGTTATLFLYSTQSSTAQLNRSYWDQASLTGGGSGGAVAGAATAIPTAPPEVAFVVPQNARDDGSIVHIVQTGDTIDSIAVAYGMTRQQIMDLNNISDPRIIQLGQEIIIKEPLPTSGESFTEELPDATQEADSGSTEEPTGAESTPEAESENGDGQTTVVLPTIQAPGQSSDNESPEGEAQIGNTSAPAPVVSVANGSVLPSSDPSTLVSSVCVLLFDDTNQNRIQEQDEALLAGGSINLSGGAEVTDSVQTDGISEPQCFEGLAAGAYIIAASAPADYGLTSPDQLRLDLLPGTTIDVAFGAAAGVAPVAPPPADAGGIVNDVQANETDTNSTVDQILDVSGLVVFGLAAVVLIAGLGLTLFMRRR